MATSWNRTEQRGRRHVFGGELDVVSGGELDIESGAAFKIAGIQVTSSAAELNAVDGLTATVAELNYLDIATLGTGAASKAVVLDAGDDYTWPATGVLTYGGTGITATGAELNLLDGSTTANAVASKAAILDATKQVRTTANVGAANTGVTAVEYGDGRNHVTVLTVSQADALTIADNAAIADGYLLYTFPAGAVVVDYAYMSMAVTAASTEAQSDTPDVGLGAVIGTGAVATLDGTGTFEDIITGQTAADANGTATVRTALPTAGTPFIIEAAAAHTVHFNAAATWADDTGGDLTADIAGTVVLVWRFMA